MPPAPRRDWCWLVLLLLPPLAHLPHLALGMSENPIYFVANLVTDVPNDLLAGLPGFNDANVGMQTQALGGLAARQWLHGVVPWWNPYSGVGLPLAAEGQNSALFLPFVLLLNAFDGVVYLKIAMQMLAGLASYALLRQLGMVRRVALLGAVLYEFNGSFAWVAHGPIMPLPFLPLLLLGIERALGHARAKRPGGWAWISVALAYSLYAGFPETAFIDGLLGLAWAGFRLARAGEARRDFSRKVVVGGVLGLLIAAPGVLPFLQLLPQSAVGGHAGTVTFTTPADDFAVYLFPYLYGPIYYGFRWNLLLWAPVGGYVGLAALLLAVLGLRSGRQAGLRRLLAVWVAVGLARAAGLPGTIWLFGLVPLLRQTLFSVYAVASWEMAAIILVAFALDDWHRGMAFTRRRLAVAGVLCAAAAGISLLAAWPAIRMLLHAAPDYPVFPIASLAWGGGVAAACGVLLAARCTRRRSTALLGILALDALMLFGVPLLSGARHAAYDRGGIKFLQAHLGMQRFMSLAPLVANYGALFGIAGINHNYVPVPQRWVDYVQAHLDPQAGTSFGAPRDRAEVPRLLAAYEAVGVAYVLAPVGANPLVQAIASLPPGATSAGAQALFAGQTLSGTLPGERVEAGRIDRFAVVIATYAGQADGALAVQLCTPRDCTTGSAPLAGVADNAGLDIALKPPLAVRDGDVLRYRITHAGGAHPVAVYLWRTRSGVLASLLLSYARDQPVPRLVYRDRLMNIFRLAAPAPYFAVSGADCTLAPASRTALRADCKAPATLLRREFFYPGWRATVNGAAARIAPVDDIFQGIALPAGRSRISFAYAPPDIGLAYAAFAIGLAGLFLGLVLGWRGRSACEAT